MRGAREYRIAGRLRHLIPSRCEHFGDEERIAGRLAIQLLDVRDPTLGQSRDCARRERQELQPMHTNPRKLAQHNPQRMCAAELVPVGDNKQRRKAFDASPEQRQNIERRFIGPMNVLQDNNRRRPPACLAHQHGHNLERPRAALERPGELSTCELRDVEQRSQRTCCEKRDRSRPTGRTPRTQPRHRTAVTVPSSRSLPHHSGARDAPVN